MFKGTLTPYAFMSQNAKTKNKKTTTVNVVYKNVIISVKAILKL